MKGSKDRLRCPVCRAPFRGSARCPRCGADLTELMRIALRALEARSEARLAVLAGDTEGASMAAERAQALQDTRAGRGLGLLSRWLRATERR